MKKVSWATLALIVLGAFMISQAEANPIDDQCPQLTYKQAPVVQADLYICHQEYAVAYSYLTKNPIYTTEYLTKEHTGKLPRTNDFRVDPAVPPQYQASPKDYVKTQCNGGRCDKGHMTPDQDFSSCSVCVHESFFMTNMVPQNFNNNEQIWKTMEAKIRAYVIKHGPVYVITGPLYSGKTGTIGKNKISVPSQLFKVMIPEDGVSPVAFLMPNTELSTSDLPKYRVSISAVEQATGIHFDDNLDKQTISNWEN